MATNDMDMDIQEELEIKADARATKKEKRERQPKKEKNGKKSGWLGKLIALFLGLVMGIAGGLGGVGGLAYYLATKKTIREASDLITSFSGFPIPLSEYLTNEYADKTLLDAAKQTLDVAKKIADGTGTLNDARAISPKVDDLVKGKTGLLSFFSNMGIQLNAETVMSKKLLKPNTVTGEDTSYFTDYIVHELKAAPAGDVLKANKFSSNKLIDSVVYGEKGIDYVIDENGNKKMNEGKFQLTIGELLGDGLMTRLKATPLDGIMDIKQSNTMLCELAYGPKHRYVYDETTNTVSMQQMFYTFDGTSFFDDEKNEVLATHTLNEDGTYTLTFEDGTKQLVKLENEKYMVYTTEGEAILYKKTLYGDLEGDFEKTIDKISLPSVLGVKGKDDKDAHAVMKAIAYDDAGNPRTLGMFKKDNAKIMDGIKLSTVIPVDTKSNVIMYILYGRKDVHYTVDGTGAVTPKQQRVAVLDGKVFNAYGEEIKGAVANDAATQYTLNEITYTLSGEGADLKPINVKWLEYKKAYLYSVAQNGTTLEEPVAVYETKVYTAKGELITGAVANAEATEYTLNDVTYTLTKKTDADQIDVPWEEKSSMADTYYVSLDGTPLMYQENTIGTLKDGTTISKITDRMTLQEFVDVKGNRILKNVGDKTISQIPDAINKMTIEEVFGDTFYYRVTNGTLDAQGKPVLTKFRINEAHQFIDANNNVVTGYYLCYMNGTKIDLDGDDTTQTRDELDLALTGSWKYILRSKDKDTGKYFISHSATLTDMDGIMDNMMHNIHDASIRELQADGMVSGLDLTTMDQKLMDSIPAVTVVEDVPTKVDKSILIDGKVPSQLDGDTTDVDTVGDLTIEQLLKYTAAILKAVSPAT